MNRFEFFTKVDWSDFHLEGHLALMMPRDNFEVLYPFFHADFSKKMHDKMLTAFGMNTDTLQLLFCDFIRNNLLRFNSETKVITVNFGIIYHKWTQYILDQSEKQIKEMTREEFFKEIGGHDKFIQFNCMLLKLKMCQAKLLEYYIMRDPCTTPIALQAAALCASSRTIMRIRDGLARIKLINVDGETELRKVITVNYSTIAKKFIENNKGIRS